MLNSVLLARVQEALHWQCIGIRWQISHVDALSISPQDSTLTSWSKNQDKGRFIYLPSVRQALLINKMTFARGLVSERFIATTMDKLSAISARPTEMEAILFLQSPQTKILIYSLIYLRQIIICANKEKRKKLLSVFTLSVIDPNLHQSQDLVDFAHQTLTPTAGSTL